MKKFSNVFKVLFIALFTFAFAWTMSCGGAAGAVVSITVTPASPSIVAGTTQQFTATGARADGSTVDVTATVTWSSSDTAVADFATPDTNGLATGVAAGTATITATDDAGISGSTDVTVATVSGTIQSLYPNNGSNWNDYVANDGADIFTATDTACDAATAGPGYDACLNGGIFRAVTVTGRGVCDGLTASDSLSLFTWVCDSNTNDVRMVAVGFADGMGLSDLVDFDTAAWKPLTVTVLRDGNPYLVTDATTLFTNTIVVNNTGTGMNTGEIHVVNTSTPNAKYTIGADKVALLIKPGVTKHGLGAADNVIEAIGRSFVWIEGALDATGDNIAIHLSDVKFSVVMNAFLEYANNTGVNMVAASNNNYIHGVYVAGRNTTITGFNVAASTGNSFNTIFVTDTSNDAIYVQALSTGNRLVDVVITNSGFVGLNVDSSDNLLMNITSFNSVDPGIQIAVGDNVIINSTVANTGDSGFYIVDNSNLLINANTANHATHGFRIEVSNENTFENTVSANNGGNGYNLAVSDNNYFTGLLKVGSNTGADCVPGAGTDPGLDAACDPQGPVSDFTKTTGVNLGSSFVAEASSDSVNANGATGVEAYNNITDWINFENMFRGWGKKGTNFPAVDQRGRCIAGQDCRIWDWSMATADTVIRDVLALPTGNDTITHTWTDASTTTFLRNAVEVMFDWIGNENGLCESNETCLYTPNIGSYQGHGNLVSAGTFTDGTITGVTLMKYETNGR